MWTLTLGTQQYADVQHEVFWLQQEVTRPKAKLSCQPQTYLGNQKSNSQDRLKLGEFLSDPGRIRYKNLVLTGPHWSLRVLTGPYWLFLVPTGSYWSLLVLTGPNWFLMVPTGPNWFLLVLTGAHLTFWPLTGLYWSLPAFTGPNWFILVLTELYWLQLSNGLSLFIWALKRNCKSCKKI